MSLFYYISVINMQNFFLIFSKAFMCLVYFIFLLAFYFVISVSLFIMLLYYYDLFIGYVFSCLNCHPIGDWSNYFESPPSADPNPTKPLMHPVSTQGAPFAPSEPSVPSVSNTNADNGLNSNSGNGVNQSSNTGFNHAQPSNTYNSSIKELDGIPLHFQPNVLDGRAITTYPTSASVNGPLSDFYTATPKTSPSTPVVYASPSSSTPSLTPTVTPACAPVPKFDGFYQG